MPHETTVSMSAQDDQTDVMRFGGVNDPLPRRRSFHGETSSPKTRVLRERRAKRGRLFGSLAYFIRGIGIEVALCDRLKTNIGGLPYTEHKCVAIGR